MSLRRPARVLFLSLPEDCILADSAARWARRLGPGWVEARAISAGPDRSAGRAAEHAPTADTVAWADTVVIVSMSDAFEPPELPLGTRSIRWRIAAHGNAERVEDRLRERVRGMIGGLRLLSAMRD